MNIKKTALALGSALMLFTTTLNAQEQPWSLGVKAGGGLSWLRGLNKLEFGNNKSENAINVIGVAGLTAGYAFHENVGMGIEVLYSGLGGQVKEKLESGSGSQEKPHKALISTHNLVVPLMVKFFPMGCDPDDGILNIHLGIQGEFPLFDATVKKSKLNDRDKLEKDKEFKKEFLKSMTLSGIGGIGYEFPEIGLTLEGRYTHGLVDTSKDTTEAKDYKETIGLKKDQKLINQSFTVSVGYNFARLLMD